MPPADQTPPPHAPPQKHGSKQGPDRTQAAHNDILGDAATPALTDTDAVPEDGGSSAGNMDNEDANPQDMTLRFAGRFHRGPLPPPDVLADYERLLPGSVERVMDWADKQMNHRHRLETLSVEGAEKRMARGQWIAACIAVSGLAASLVVGVWGNPWAAAVIASVAVGGPAAAIVLSRGLGAPQNEKAKSRRPPRP